MRPFSRRSPCRDCGPSERRSAWTAKRPVHSDFSGVEGEALPKFELNADGYGTRVSGKDIFWYPLPKDVKLVCSSEVIFRMTGSAQPMTITLQSGNEVRYVIIDVVGRVRVSLAPPEE